MGAAVAVLCCACLVLAMLGAGILYYLVDQGETPGGNTTFQEVPATDDRGQPSACGICLQ